MGYPPLSMAWAKMARSSAVENRPACPAMPPSTLAFSSCYLALNDAEAEAAIVGGWRDRVLQSVCGIEGRVRHAQRSEDFALAERVERFVGEAFERDAENNEADVAVFGAGAGGGGERRGESGSQNRFASLGTQEKLFVSRQAGAVCEQHAHGDVAAALAAHPYP